MRVEAKDMDAYVIQAKFKEWEAHPEGQPVMMVVAEMAMPTHDQCPDHPIDEKQFTLSTEHFDLIQEHGCFYFVAYFPINGMVEYPIMDGSQILGGGERCMVLKPDLYLAMDNMKDTFNEVKLISFK